VSRPCGLQAIDCVTDHVCPALDGRKVPSGWRGRCPVCRADRALSITVKGPRILWNCHHAPACDRIEIRAALSALLPCCFGPRADTRRTRAEDELLALALDPGVTPSALRLRVVMLYAGLSAPDAAAKLGMGRTAYYDALQRLGRRRSLEIRTELQVSSVRKSGLSQSAAAVRKSGRRRKSMAAANAQNGGA
jgi:hypothetical protein